LQDVLKKFEETGEVEKNPAEDLRDASEPSVDPSTVH